MPRLEELVALIELGREDRSVEYKESLAWDNLKNKIAKTALGMVSIRDGGTIAIGVSERSGGPVPEGMPAEDVGTYDEDDIRAYVNRFADPYVRLELHRVSRDELEFIAIVVHEFDQVPVVCKRDSIGLRNGAIYTRSHRMPETCEVPSQTEMRKIIDMATDKGVRRFLERGRAVGLLPGETADRTDSEKYDEELEGL